VQVEGALIAVGDSQYVLLSVAMLPHLTIVSFDVTNDSFRHLIDKVNTDGRRPTDATDSSKGAGTIGTSTKHVTRRSRSANSGFATSPRAVIEID
jgi:hypothetical protein